MGRTNKINQIGSILSLCWRKRPLPNSKPTTHVKGTRSTKSSSNTPTVQIPNTVWATTCIARAKFRFNLHVSCRATIPKRHSQEY